MITGQTKAATFAGGIPNCQLRRRKFTGIITRMRATAPSPQDAINHAAEDCGRRRYTHPATPTKVATAMRSPNGPKNDRARKNRQSTSFNTTTSLGLYRRYGAPASKGTCTATIRITAAAANTPMRTNSRVSRICLQPLHGSARGRPRPTQQIRHSSDTHHSLNIMHANHIGALHNGHNHCGGCSFDAVVHRQPTQESTNRPLAGGTDDDGLPEHSQDA